MKWCVIAVGLHMPGGGVTPEEAIASAERFHRRKLSIVTLGDAKFGDYVVVPCTDEHFSHKRWFGETMSSILEDAGYDVNTNIWDYFARKYAPAPDRVA